MCRAVLQYSALRDSRTAKRNDCLPWLPDFNCKKNSAISSLILADCERIFKPIRNP